MYREILQILRCPKCNEELALITEKEEDSEIIFCGDMAQVDFRQGAKHSGMNHMIESLEGDKLFGVVKLVKSERGPVPRLCDKIIPPR